MAKLNTVKSFRGTSKTESGNLTCGKCRKEIVPGMSYQWWANRSPGMRGGHKKIRCMDCPPSLADRTPGRAGEWMRMEEEIEQTISNIGTHDDLESTAAEIADRIRDFGQGFVDGADNMEEGFGHETSTSSELRERGEEIQGVADSLEYLSFEEFDPDDMDEDDIAEAREEHLDRQRDEIRETVSEVCV